MEYQDWIEQEAENQRREILREKMARFVPADEREVSTAEQKDEDQNEGCQRIR